MENLRIFHFSKKEKDKYLTTQVKEKRANKKVKELTILWGHAPNIQAQSSSTMAWKQAPSTTCGGLDPHQALTVSQPCVGGQPRLLGNQEKTFSLNFTPRPGNWAGYPKNTSYILLIHLVVSNDVETNPGPIFEILNYNVRGLKDYHKTKRLLNYMHRIQKCEIGVAFIQETHI